MKKFFKLVLLAAVLTALGVLPFHSTDVARLLPVRTVIVTRSGDEYVIDVGAGVKAVGRTLRAALDRLREEVTGEAFFGTAEQVIVTDEAADAIPAVAGETAFRPAAGLYLAAEAPDAEKVTAFLETHPSNVTVLDARIALAEGRTPALPRLEERDGGYIIRKATGNRQRATGRCCLKNE